MFGKESGNMSTAIRPELSKSSKYWMTDIDTMS